MVGMSGPYLAPSRARRAASRCAALKWTSGRSDRARWTKVSRESEVEMSLSGLGADEIEIAERRGESRFLGLGLGSEGGRLDELPRGERFEISVAEIDLRLDRRAQIEGGFVGVDDAAFDRLDVILVPAEAGAEG